MMENLKEIIRRLSDDPDRIATMIIQRAAASDELHSHLDMIQSREVKIAGDVAGRRKNDGSLVFANRELREAEAIRILATDTDYIEAKTNADFARTQLRQLDAAIESATRRNSSDEKIVGLITALINAGKCQEANEIVLNYQVGAATTSNNSIQQEKQDINQGTSNNATAVDTNATTTALVTVLEARPGTSPGTIRAYCKAQDGTKVAVFAKNGNGQTLLSAIGLKVQIEYQKVDRGWFAYKVLIAA